MKISKVLLIFLFVATLYDVSSQGLCYRFVDTTYIDANIVKFRVMNCPDCPDFNCVVQEDYQFENALKDYCSCILFDTENRVPFVDDSLLLLATSINARQFAVMKTYLEDPLSSRFSRAEICSSIGSGIHLDTVVTIYKDLSPVLLQDRIVGDLIFLGKEDNEYDLHLISQPEFCNWTDSAIKMLSLQIPDPVGTDTIQIQDSFVIVKVYPFRCWGLIAEVDADCRDLFWSETGETLLIDCGYSVVRIFIPLSARCKMHQY